MQSDLQKTGMRALAAAVAPFWAGEAEIARVYFSRPRTLAQELHWLTAQACKEMLPFSDLPQPLIDELLATGAITHHPRGEAAATHIAQEYRHFSLLADLIFDLSGRRLTLADLTQLPEDRTLQDKRAAYRERGALETAAAAFTEGGGGAVYRVISQLEGGAFERRLAEIFKVIHADEIVHGPMAIHTIAAHAHSVHAWQTVTAIVCELSRQRLLMRNEMFGHPLDAPRLQDLCDGKIAPWEMPIAI
jgi:hypothetical protein